jgi:hypothetical protein
LLCDAFSPQSQLPGLRVGQTWTVPVFTPLAFGKSPVEIVYATVESVEPVLWNGSMTDCWLVVYRTDTGNGGSHREWRGKLWVSRDGTVVKQQVVLFDSTITFDRLPEDEALKLAKAAGPQWWSMENDLRDETHDAGGGGSSTAAPTVENDLRDETHD